MRYPEFAEIEGKKYKINTDFRIAIKCNEIAEDKNISDYERVLAIIYLLYGDEGIDTPKHYEKLFDIAKKYLLCGEEKKEYKSNEKKDMDYIQDYGYIWASFMSDYNGLDIDNTEMHWWKFYDLLNGLSNSELGNCCVLNRIRNIRNMNINEIKDSKERKKVIELQKRFSLTNQVNHKKPNKKEKESAIEFLKMLKNGKE